MYSQDDLVILRQQNTEAAWVERARPDILFELYQPIGERIFIEFKTTSFEKPREKPYHGPTLNGMQFITFEKYYTNNTIYFIYSTYSKNWYVFRPQDVRNNIISINFVYELDANVETIGMLRQRLPEVSKKVIHRNRSDNPKASNLNYICIDMRKIKQIDEWIAKLQPLD